MIIDGEKIRTLQPMADELALRTVGGVVQAAQP